MQTADEQYRLMVEQIRSELMQTVDALCDRLLAGGAITPSMDACKYPLKNFSFFKGKVPVAVWLPDGSRRSVRTWKEAVTVVLQFASAGTAMLERLMALRGNVHGRQRTLLAESPDGMGYPVEIAPGLFIETQFDTETLLRVLARRILDEIGFDSSGIMFQVRTRIRQ